MHAQLETLRQTVGFHRVSDHGDVIGELLAELLRVADIVDALVESPRELRRDGLDRYALVSDCREDDQKFSGGLWIVGLVHRNLCDERALTLGCLDVAVDATGLLHSEEELGGGRFDALASRLERLVDSIDLDPTEEFRVARDQAVDGRALGCLADGVRDVQGEEVARVEIAVDSVQIDVIGVHVVGTRPSKGLDRCVSGVTHSERLSADREVFPVGLVPSRDYRDSAVSGKHTCLQLWLRLVGEAIPDAKRVFFYLHTGEEGGRSGRRPRLS